MSKFFAKITELPPDPLFGLKARYVADSRPDKVDLGIGAYRDNYGKPWILPAVKKAEAKLVASADYNHEYLSIEGHKPFLTEAAKVILGSDAKAISDGRVILQQSLSGTGALHLAGTFLKQHYTPLDGSSKLPIIYLSKPTWGNHVQIFQTLGFETQFYPYWNNDTKTLDFQGYLNTIKLAPEGSVFILHACAHNPTGLDPTLEEWEQILTAIAAKKHIPLFDLAYQGFASGDLNHDNFAVRLALSPKIGITTPILICQSFAKNVGMYGERVGAVHLVLPEQDAKLAAAIKSQFAKIIRSEISNPPAYGAKIVATILNDSSLRSQWEDDLKTMSSRIIKMRNKLKDTMVNTYKTPGNWDHIVSQTGMFSFTGLTQDMCTRLEKTHGIYLLGSGRISVAGLNDGNVERVAKSFDEVVRHFKPKL